MIRSPIPIHIRGKYDRDFSFSTKVIEEKIRWKDFGFTSTIGADIYALNAYINHQGDREASYQELSQLDLSYEPLTGEEKRGMIKLPINFKKSLLRAEHLMYYETLNVNWSILLEYGTSGLESISRGGDSFWNESEEDFGFLYNTGGGGMKAHRPFTSGTKYLHTGLAIPEGYEQLPPSGTKLCITKGMKDILFLRSIGIWSIGGGSESLWDSILNRKDELQNRFPDIFFWVDPDMQGEKYVAALKEGFGDRRQIKTPEGKDPTDVWLNTRNERYILDLIG